MQRGYFNSIFWLQKDDSGLEYVIKGAISDKNYFVFLDFQPYMITDQHVTYFKLQFKEPKEIEKGSEYLNFKQNVCIIGQD